MNKCTKYVYIYTYNLLNVRKKFIEEGVFITSDNVIR